MTSKELKAIWGLGIVFALRIFGVFMVLPLLSTYGRELKDANDILIGLAIGIYGITQAICQIPFSLISDRFGHKRLIIIGLFIFITGSIVAATTKSIWGVIIGRALQGSSAISGAVMALLSNLTTEENRTKAMAFMGVNFGFIFAVALVIGPIISHLIHLNGLFWIMSFLALSGILVTYFVVPNDESYIINRKSYFIKNGIQSIISNHQLIKLNLSIFCLHALLMANFTTLPLIMVHAGLLTYYHWKIYLITLLISFIMVLPFIIYAEKQHRIKQVFLLCINILFASELIFYFSNQQLWLIILALQLFFIAFNIMEILLPSLITKTAPIEYKGTAMGLYSTCQFLGVALGGILDGYFLQSKSINLVFIFNLILCMLWFIVSLSIQQPAYIASIRLFLPNQIKNFHLLQTKLMNEPGVNEVVLDIKTLSAYIKINKKIINQQQLEVILKNYKHNSYYK